MSDSFKVFNSLGKKKEIFYTNKKNQVSMYVCGPTVYDLLHVGNFRGPIFFNFFPQIIPIFDSGNPILAKNTYRYVLGDGIVSIWVQIFLKIWF